MRDFAYAEIATDFLDIPDLAPEPDDRLTRAQIMVLEAVHILSLGLDDVPVDIRAIKALLARSWTSQTQSRHLDKLCILGLLTIKSRVGAYAAYALTHEGRLERFSQRVGVFQ
jgi:hypothetical protein